MHFEEEDFGVGIGAGGEYGVLDEFENILTEVIKFPLDFLLVLLEELEVLGSLGLLLLFDGRQGPPGGPKNKY